ncbi:hypothetical protein IFO70_10930 [Phormidium tenue FACHB-886]|nr:hypothetical protein [Phormidium tenue FACHB-886]
MQNFPAHTVRQLACRMGDRRGFMLPTVAHSGCGAEFGDRSSTAQAHGLVVLLHAAVSVLADALRLRASGDCLAQGIDLFNLSNRQQLEGFDPERRSGRERFSVFPLMD